MKAFHLGSFSTHLPELSLSEVGWSPVLFGFIILVCLARLKKKEVY